MRVTLFAVAGLLIAPLWLCGQEAVIEVPAAESAGFNSPDDLEVHRASAKRLASAGEAHRIGDRLNTPVLVPVFPRPRSQPKIYTHFLDRDSMRIQDGP